LTGRWAARVVQRAEGMEASMKCLRIYSTEDGESHFDEVEIPTSSRQVHPNAAAFEVSASYAATGIRFTRIPSGARQVDWHTVPERVLTVRLDGSADYQTSDGDERHVPVVSFCSRTQLARDTNRDIRPKSRQSSGLVCRAASTTLDVELH